MRKSLFLLALIAIAILSFWLTSSSKEGPAQGFEAEGKAHSSPASEEADSLAEALAHATAEQPGQAASQIEVKRAKLDAIQTPSNLIRVFVSDVAGVPLRNAEIRYLKVGQKYEGPKQGVTSLGYQWRTPSDQKEEDGSQLVRVRVLGKYVIAAKRFPDFDYQFSAPTEGGQNVHLVLPPLNQDCLITGKILGPKGVSPGLVNLQFMWMDRGKQVTKRGKVTPQGDFVVRLDKPHLLGALHASAHFNQLRSVAMRDVKAGTHGLELSLGEARLFSLEVLDENDLKIDYASASFAWRVGEFSIEDQFNSSIKRQRAEDEIRWELPDVHFTATVQAPWHEPLILEDVDPASIGSKLVVHLKKVNSFFAHVMHAGEPVKDANVLMTYADQFQPTLIGWSPVPTPISKSARSDATGRFRIVADRPGRVFFKASHYKYGMGELPIITFDPLLPPIDLKIVLDKPIGRVRGKVILPEGHQTNELYVKSTGSVGHVILAQDGSYLLKDVQPGPQRISFLDRGGASFYSNEADPMGAAGLEDLDAFSWSHGPNNAPQWLMPEVSFNVTIPAGKIVELDIDLTRPQACILEGQILLNAVPPPLQPKEVGMLSTSAYRVRLKSDGSWAPDCQSSLDAEGRFRLEVETPGTFLLQIQLPVGQEHEWKLVDLIEMRVGTSHWKKDLGTGSLRIMPKMNNGVLEANQSHMQWIGAGDLRVSASGSMHEESRVVLYAIVPAGRIQLYKDSDSGQRVVLNEAMIVNGKQTTIDNP